MKNINRFFAIVLFIVFSVSAWGVTSTFTNSSLGVGSGEPTWTSSNAASGFEENSYARGVQWGSGKSTTLTCTSISGTITQVDVVASTNGNSSSLAVTVGSTTFKHGGNNSASITSGTAAANTSYSFTGSASGTISITVTNTASKSVYVKSITVTTSSGSYTITAISNNDSWGTVSGTTTITATPNSGYKIKDSGAYTVTSGTATVTRGTGSNSNKFTVTPTSNCTIRINFEALPSYTIRFFDGTTKLKEESVVSGGTATPPSNPAGCEDFTFLGWWTAELAEDNTTSHTWITDFTVTGNQDYYAVYQHAGGGSTIVSFDATIDPATKGGITLSVTGGALNNGTDYRVWKNQTMTITSSAGNMSSIVLTFENASYDGGGWASSYSPNAGTWTSPTASGEQAHITNIVITVGSVFYTSTADCRSCYEPTLSFDVTSVNKFVGDDKFTYTATPANNPMGGTVTYTSNKPTKASVNSSTGEVTILDAMSDEPITITATLGVVDNGVNCQKKATATYTLNIYNKVTWLVNGVAYHEGSPTEQTTEGGSITSYPTDPDGDEVCGGKTFVGWTNASYPENDAAPTILYTSLSSMSGVHPTDNVTFYAVVAEAGGGSDEIDTKGTSSDLEEGKKVVIGPLLPTRH